ncbi:MAG: hypothetical protein CMQ61_00990 [Gammaproteobacteria bacterium]|nr:hypothetical protein [Gammaproteobacteria bacterium]|tara:strand:+ start:70 stop:723 length:654 start_codon:yes stop_codon:yes gene_type:complete
MLSFVDAVGHLSFILSALSFIMRDMLMLRSVALVSSAVGIYYNYAIPAGPLWLVIFWLSVFALIHVYRIIELTQERRRVHFTDEELELHQTVFQNFSPVEFMKMLRLAQWRSAPAGTVLAAEDEPQPELALLFNGEVVVTREGAEIARGRDGTLIGEMTFIRGGDASATVTTLRESRYIVWSQVELRRLLRRNPTMDVALQSVFNVDLVRKLTGNSN